MRSKTQTLLFGDLEDLSDEELKRSMRCLGEVGLNDAAESCDLDRDLDGLCCWFTIKQKEASKNVLMSLSIA